MLTPRQITIACVFLLAIPILPLQAATSYWNAATGTNMNWTNAAAWSNGIPGPADTAIFTNTARGVATISTDVSCGNLTIATNYSSIIMFATGVVGSLTVNGDLYLGSNSTILATWTSVDTNGLGTGRVINVTGNATILGKLSATGQGFPQHLGPGWVMAYAAQAWSSHGGRGYAESPTYGSLTNPVELGAGGHVSPCDGGGAIKLTVGSNLTVNGQIEANGLPANVSGAGGSLWINCYSLAGSGSICADSAISGTQPGAGGRVALYYTNSTFSGSISAAGYQAGTLWEPNKFTGGTPATPQTMVINDSGFRYTFPDSTLTNYVTLIVSNGTKLAAYTGYGSPMASIAFYGGCLVITNLDLRGQIRFNYLDSRGTYDTITSFSMSNLLISGNVMLRQGTAWLPAQGIYSNIATLTVSNVFTIRCGSDTSVVNPDSSGSQTITQGVGVVISCQDAFINGTISGLGLGWGVMDPTGPLRGTHGGVKYGAAAGDRPYGNLTRPSSPGANSSGNNGLGGSAFSLFAAGNVVLNGTTTCAGAYAPGGTVRIACSSLSGTGMVSAAGDNVPNGLTGQGGGRVALEYANSTFTGQIKVDSTGPVNPGSKGTVFLCTSPVPGAVTFVSTGVKLSTAFSISGGVPSLGSSNGVQVTRNVTEWQTNKLSLRWTDACSTILGGSLTNIAAYTVSGLPQQMYLYVYTNDTLVCRTNTGVSGSVAVAGVNLLTAQTIRVEQPPPGMVFLIH